MHITVRVVLWKPKVPYDNVVAAELPYLNAKPRQNPLLVMQRMNSNNA